MVKHKLKILLLSFLFLCNGCQKETPTSFSTPLPVVQEENDDALIDELFTQEETTKEEVIDLDLTKMSSTMIYSEVANMMLNPSAYENQVIKIAGYFTTGEDFDGNLIFGCIIPDATACCAQGVEFILKDALSYPQDFPEEGHIIIIQGIFTYEKDGYAVLLKLKDATMWL